MTNTITAIAAAASSSSDISDLLVSTIFFSFLTVGYGLLYMKKKLESLEKTKKDLDENDIVETEWYQSWNGTYANGVDSLIITIVRQKACTKNANEDWIELDTADDTTIVTRNFYLGNENPSFNWVLEKREFDTKAVVKDTMMDGWASLVHIKLTAFMKEDVTSNQMNMFVKKLCSQNLIEWQKQLLPKEEFTAIFH